MYLGDCMNNLGHKIIYLDHAATTKIDDDVLEAMLPFMKETYGNANSTHQMGRNAVKGLDYARDLVASLINASSNEIYFTSGGTEGDNWALDIALNNRGNRNKVVYSSIEHVAMLSPIERLDKDSFVLNKISPKSDGIIDTSDYLSAVDENAFFTTSMLVNNEIGTIEPIEKLSNIAHEKGSLFFTDAVQGIVHLKIDVKKLGVDMLSASAHKFCGPKGIGFLYIKKDVKVHPMIIGGHQERGKRGGTSNVANCVGLALALKKNYDNLEKRNEYVSSLRDRFIDGVLRYIPNTRINGSLDKELRVANNANITFSGISGEALLMNLDLYGICASLGAACSAGSLEPSHVLREIGIDERDSMSTIRFSFGEENTVEDVDYVVIKLKEICKKLV